MNYATNFKRTLALAAASVMLVTVGMSGTASAAVQYDPNGTPTTKTPVFNQFYGVPNGVGNEADFVRVKTKAGTNADYANNINGACAADEVYTVRTYVHNGADPAYNTAENASAVTRDAVVAMTAPLNALQNQFEFKSTISASNAAKVTDNGFLTCANGKKVKLSLVPSSVQTYSKPLGFQGAADSSVNGSLKIGSRVQGSGDVFACWDDRVIVSYDVKVVVPKEEVPPTTTTPPTTTPPTTTPPVVTPPTPPKGTGGAELPNTGPAGVAGAFMAVTAVSTAAYNLVMRRRASL